MYFEEDQQYGGRDDQDHVDNDEDRLKEASSIPLYNTRNVFRLSTMLLILNLQATYAWSDSSVDALFRYVKFSLFINFYI